MRLFVESSSIIAERWGIGQFAKRLVEVYHKEYPSQAIKLFAFHFITRPFNPPIPQDKNLGYRLVRLLPGKIYVVLFKLGIPVPIDPLIGAKKQDVILFPNFVRWPLLYNRRSLSFVHDLSFILYGQYSSPKNRNYMLKYVPKTIKKSTHILTISENSKKEIIKHFDVHPDKISIVYPFIDTSFFYKRKVSEIDAVRKKYSLPEKYILFVSSIEPRKNVGGLIDAYASLPQKIKKEHGLVLAGGRGWLNEDIHAKADKMVAKGLHIVRTGYVPDEDLPAMYSGASLFTFPSHYEGFGIPPLEAMACGVPVITSNNSSLPEVVDDAAVLVDAKNTKRLAKCIADVLSDPVKQHTLIAKGIKQCQKFTPEKSARQLQEAISKL